MILTLVPSALGGAPARLRPGDVVRARGAFWVVWILAENGSFAGLRVVPQHKPYHRSDVLVDEVRDTTAMGLRSGRWLIRMAEGEANLTATARLGRVLAPTGRAIQHAIARETGARRAERGGGKIPPGPAIRT